MDTPTPEEREFLTLLPWYLNGTLGDEDRERCRNTLEHSPRARAWLERERLIAAATEATLEPAAEEVGLGKLRERLRAEQAAQAAQTAQRGGASAGRTAGRPGAFQRLLAWLTTPYAAGALATAVALQFVVIGVMSSRQPELDATRHVTVQEVRTLRVKFREDLTEAQLRQALVAASAHIVGGPNQFGEWWLASPSVSVEEMRSLLEQSGVLTAAAIDTQGPQ